MKLDSWWKSIEDHLATGSTLHSGQYIMKWKSVMYIKLLFHSLCDLFTVLLLNFIVLQRYAKEPKWSCGKFYYTVSPKFTKNISTNSSCITEVSFYDPVQVTALQNEDPPCWKPSSYHLQTAKINKNKNSLYSVFSSFVHSGMILG